MLLILLSLAACGEQQASSESNDFAAALENATAALEEVRSGTRHVEKGSPDAPYGTPFDDYRLKRLKDAAEHLRPFANGGTAGRRVAATRLLAAASAAEARSNLRDASVAWAELAPSAARLTELATRAIVAQEALTAQAAVSQSEQIADLQAREQQLTSQADEITNRLNQINSVVSGHEEAIAGFESQRQQRIDASAELSSRAFQSNGELGFDLTKQAATESRAADALSAQSEGHRIELDIASARKRLIETELNHTRAQLDRVRQAITAARNRAQQGATATTDARNHAEQMVQEFDQLTRDMAEAKSSAINPLLDQIADQATESADQLEAMKRAFTAAASEGAGREGQQETELTAAAGTANAAQVIRAAADIHRSYANLFSTTAQRIAANLPNQAAQLNEAAAPAAAAADELTAAAHEHFNAAVTALDSLDNAGDNVGNTALNILAQVYDAMATDSYYTGDTEEAQRLFTLRQQALDRMAPEAE